VAVKISVPNDNPSQFHVPWGELPDGTFEHCYVGTTDTDYPGDVDRPQADEADLAYVLNALAHALDTTITADDVTGVWAGLRPLVKAAESVRTADLSRRHSIRTSEAGLVTVTGGKLTTYRQMADDTVNAVMRQLGRRGRCRTKRLSLIGASGFRPVGREHPDAHLVARYGSEAPEVKALIALDAGLSAPLVPGLRYTRAEAVFAARHEMATTIDDVLMRRTRAHLQDRAACYAAAPDVADLLAGELAWSAERAAREVAAYRSLCDAEVAAATSAAGSSA
jgi:glycerol-3-phosphate dehydrogenase